MLESLNRRATDGATLCGIDPATIEEMRAKLPPEYHEFLDVFNRSKADELPPHRPYDHKIELEGERQPPKSRLYPMSGYKLQKVNKWVRVTPGSAVHSLSYIHCLPFTTVGGKESITITYCLTIPRTHADRNRERSVTLIPERASIRAEFSQTITILLLSCKGMDTMAGLMGTSFMAF